jgi:chemotaxis protein MotA
MALRVLSGGMRLRVQATGVPRELVLVLAGAVVATVVSGVAGLLDPVALLITLGGGIGVTAVTFSRARLAGAWEMVEAALVAVDDREEVLATLKRLARVHRVEGVPALERAAQSSADPFVRAAIALAVDGRDADELAAALAGELRRHDAEGESARQVVLMLGKLFPAFGLIGTLVGLALLLRNLGTATSLAAIGPGLGIAVTTTLYGAVLANVVVLPLAIKLQAHLDRRHAVMQMIIDGTLLVQRKEYPTRIERLLRGAWGMPGTGTAPRTAPIGLAERAA